MHATLTPERTEVGTSAWAIDPTHSSVEFSVQHLMIAKVRGRFREFSGTVWIDTSAPDQSRVEAEIVAASIDTGEARRDEHLRSDDFLSADSFPTITFRSTGVEGDKREGWRLRGDLTIRDVRREVVLDLLDAGSGSDPWGGRRRGFNATTVIDRRDFGLTWNQALEAGGMLVGNDIKITLDVEVLAAVSAEG